MTEPLAIAVGAVAAATSLYLTTRYVNRSKDSRELLPPDFPFVEDPEEDDD